MPMTVDKSESRIRQMFGEIAGRYDFLNHFLSFGIDRYWRWQLIQMLKKENPKLILDAATGTGDLAIAASSIHPDKIFGIDISADMLAIGREKIKKRGISDKIELLE